MSKEFKVGNAILSIYDTGRVSLNSTDGYAICVIDPTRNSLYFCPQGTYDSDQVAKLEDGRDNTYNIIDNPDKQPSRDRRLARVEQTLRDLQSEVNCIRNND